MDGETHPGCFSPFYLDTLSTSLGTSQKAMKVTGEALGATIDGVDALSEMLNTTAITVSDTQPVIAQVNAVFGETLPATIEAATNSLRAAPECSHVAGERHPIF